MTDLIDQFKDGEHGAYHFLSNFYMWDDPHFGTQSVEHWYQAFKAHLWEDQKRILEAPTPGVAKRMGRSVKMRPDWEDVKLDVMYLCLKMKFSKQPYKSWLEDTRDAVLIEGNTWGDRFWGAEPISQTSALDVIRAGNEEDIWDGADHLWYGKNMLGILLMKVRDNG